jgi:hypothetical protein
MASSTETLGTFQEQLAEKPASEASLELASTDMLQHWRRVSLSSDFLAKYYSFYFPYREKAKGRISRETAENSISFVLNELIENTAKYSNTADTEVRVRVLLLERAVLLEVSNAVTANLADEFRAGMREVLAGNTEELYLAKLEANLQASQEGARSDSGLGFLTLINDYQVLLGFKFERTGADICRITVQASMNCEEA